MSRLWIGMGVLTLSLLTTSWLVGGDDKKDDPPPKAKGTLPAYWKQLGLSNDQKQQVYKIQAKYNAEIDQLKAKIEKLKDTEKEEMYKVLTEEQKKKLKELRSGEKPADKDKDTAKDKDK